MPVTKKKETYSEAMARLEKIVSQIDNNELEIDVLAEKIKEANGIIAFCSDKLTKADKEIEKLRNPGLFSRVKALSIEKVEGSKGEKNTYSVTSMATGVGNRSTVDEEGNIES